jgi:hypothetical protein
LDILPHSFAAVKKKIIGFMRKPACLLQSFSGADREFQLTKPLLSTMITFGFCPETDYKEVKIHGRRE